jgi:hypothetical protein
MRNAISAQLNHPSKSIRLRMLHNWPDPRSYRLSTAPSLRTHLHVPALTFGQYKIGFENPFIMVERAAMRWPFRFVASARGSDTAFRFC